jgi:hypothetical protein
MSMTRSAGKMFMLPVSEAKALNIVVGRPCWKYRGANLLSFNRLSVAFKKSKRTWTGWCSVSFRPGRLYFFFVRMPLSTYC